MPVLTFDGFMSHSARGGGKRKQYLSDWKKTPPHSIITWLSCKASIATLWRHGWLRVNPVEDKQTKIITREIWSDKLVCYEDEVVLTQQDFRDRETKQRQVAPVMCPHCLLLEYVYQAIASGELDWLEPLFRFDASDPRKTTILHAGGIINKFADKKMSDADKRLMVTGPLRPDGTPLYNQAEWYERGGPLYQRDAWRQNQKAKCEYAMVVADNDHPEKGLQIAIESNLLGQKIQQLIADQVKSKGPELGHPLMNPYAIQWEFNPAEDAPFDKKYHAVPMERVRIRPAIELLIRATEPPDLGELDRRFNLKTHRAQLEQHAIGVAKNFPWDSFFVKALAYEAEQEAKGNAAKAQGFAQSRPTPEVGRIAPSVPQASVAAPLKEVPHTPQAPSGVYVDPNQMVGCDGCGKAMNAIDVVCPHCGMRYDVHPAAPEPAPLPKRSEVIARAQQAATVAAPVVPDNDASDYPLSDGDDDIPF